MARTKTGVSREWRDHEDTALLTCLRDNVSKSNIAVRLCRSSSAIGARIPILKRSKMQVGIVWYNRATKEEYEIYSRNVPRGLVSLRSILTTNTMTIFESDLLRYYNPNP